MTDKRGNTTGPNRGRHEAGCKICVHPQRQEIERDFISWNSPAKIASEYKLRHRASIYRHAHALDLFPKRARNLRGALERIIEKASDVPVNASALVQAILAYAKINARGELVERQETVNINKLFDQMNPDELEAYAKSGQLPSWFRSALGATSENGREGSDHE